MTKEEVLQKVTDYCNEKSYTSATLTDAFKDKFADHFQKAHADSDINDEAMITALKFSLNTAFSSASEIATVKVNEFATKENAYKVQIAELQKKPLEQQQQQQQQMEIPKEVQEQLDELKRFKDEQNKQEKFANIVKLAKEGINKTLHASFDKYAEDYVVSLDQEDKTQADNLVRKFREIFKDSIGDIRPQQPQQTQKQEDELIESIPKIKVQ